MNCEIVDFGFLMSEFGFVKYFILKYFIKTKVLKSDSYFKNKLAITFY